MPWRLKKKSIKTELFFCLCPKKTILDWVKLPLTYPLTNETDWLLLGQLTVAIAYPRNLRNRVFRKNPVSGVRTFLLQRAMANFIPVLFEMCLKREALRVCEAHLTRFRELLTGNR